MLSLRNLVRLLRVSPALLQEFDAAFYRQQAPELKAHSKLRLLRHYLSQGWKAGFDPSPDFSTEHYLVMHPDVWNAQLNPLVHYLRIRGKEERRTHSAMDWRADIDALQGHFDVDYYQFLRPDLRGRTERLLIGDYHAHGWKTGCDPSPDFSSSGYRAKYGDVSSVTADPFLHYLRFGVQQGRTSPPGLPARWQDLNSEQIAQLRLYLDEDFYRKQLPEHPGGDVDLLRHYVETGWMNGHDPGPEFSTLYYAEEQDTPPGVCPLVHFLFAAWLEPRRGRRDAPKMFGLNPGNTLLPQLDYLMDPLANAASDQAHGVEFKSHANGLQLHWVVPDFLRGGGGHMTIFRMIRHLENLGHHCTIWIDQPGFHDTAEDAYDDIVRYFQCLSAPVIFAENGLADATGDAVIATAWTTAYTVEATQGFSAKFYFVQDYEPDFYPAGSERLLAARTYEFEMGCICASPWLEALLHEKHGRWSRGFHLAYDRGFYASHRKENEANCAGTADTARHKIAVYAREHTARRCVQLALMALSQLARQRQDFEVHFFGQEQFTFSETSFPAYSHGILDEEGLARLYNECDLALCFSATNYSLVPQEMMACGLPLVELDGDSTRAIFPDGVVTLAGPDPMDISAKMAALLDDPARMETQRSKAREWVAQFTWEGAARKVEAALLDYLSERGVDLSAPAVGATDEVRLDVVIPTYNGMGEIEPVVEALRTQKLWDQVQLHCIDSSSSDGTTEWLRSQPDVSVTVIEKGSFQHGRTRNEGAALGTAPVIAFLTQDATPIGANWAGDILRMMQHFPKAAGLFGRHEPYPDHPLYVRQEIEGHFDNMLRYPLALSRETDPVRWDSGERSWRQILHFYSDNNSAMRRSVWQEHPYPEVDYGEDQLWAREIVEAGLTKLYAPTARVYHSHDYSPEESFERAKTEAAFFFTHFGYDLGATGGKDLSEVLSEQDRAIAHWGRKHQLESEDVARWQAIRAQRYHGWRAGVEAAKRAGRPAPGA